MNQFSKLVQTWDDNPSRIDYSEALCTYIRARVNKDQRLQSLEVSSGTGTLSVLLEDEFSRVDLLDTSDRPLEEISRELAERNLYHITPIREKFLHYNPLKLYDVVYSVMYLHHVIDTTSVLKKFYDVMQTGGKLFLSDLYSEDGRYHPNTAEGVYHHGFDPDTLANTLKTMGFAINNIQTVFNFDKHDRLYPMFVIECTKE